jgi:hypothetical protein
MTDEQCWQTLETKCAEIGRRGMAPLIVTQFAFDADRTLRWLETLRSRGIVAPVRLGVPGPAGIKTLMSLRRALRGGGIDRGSRRSTAFPLPTCSAVPARTRWSMLSPGAGAGARPRAAALLPLRRHG